METRIAHLSLRRLIGDTKTAVGLCEYPGCGPCWRTTVGTGTPVVFGCPRSVGLVINWLLKYFECQSWNLPTFDDKLPCSVRFCPDDLTCSVVSPNPGNQKDALLPSERWVGKRAEQGQTCSHPLLSPVRKWKGKFTHPYGKGRIPTSPLEQPCHF